MNIVVPSPGVSPGPAWANTINTALESNIAEHTHTAGSGVQLTQAALNFTAALPMNNQSLTNAKAVQLTAQAVNPALAGSLYNVAGNLWYRNGTNVDVQITAGSTISTLSIGSITGLAGSGGTAAYSTDKFIWQKNNNTAYADMEFGKGFFFENGSLTDKTTVQAGTLAASNTLTLPTVTMALPTTKPTAGSKILSISSAGAVEPTLYKTFKGVIPTVAASVAGNTVYTGTFTGTDKPIVVSLAPDTSTQFFAQLANVVPSIANTPITLSISVRLGGSLAKQYTMQLRGFDPDNTGAGNGIRVNPFASWYYEPTAGETSSGILVEVITTINSANYYGTVSGAVVSIREVPSANTL